MLKSTSKGQQRSWTHLKANLHIRTPPQPSQSLPRAFEKPSQSPLRINWNLCWNFFASFCSSTLGLHSCAFSLANASSKIGGSPPPSNESTHKMLYLLCFPAQKMGLKEFHLAHPTHATPCKPRTSPHAPHPTLHTPHAPHAPHAPQPTQPDAPSNPVIAAFFRGAAGHWDQSWVGTGNWFSDPKYKSNPETKPQRNHQQSKNAFHSH